MKITPLNLLKVEDFGKEYQKFCSQLFAPLNSFLTIATTALQQNLDFNNNFLGQQNDLSFVWQGASTSLPIKFQIAMSGTPGSLTVCSATENRTPVILLVAWQVLNGQIRLTDIAKISSGVISTLTVGASYTLRTRIET